MAPAIVSPTGEIEGSMLFCCRPNLAEAYDPMVPSTITSPQATSKIETQKGANHTDRTNTTLIIESIPAG
jgi:hypothetical protein